MKFHIFSLLLTLLFFVSYDCKSQQYSKHGYYVSDSDLTIELPETKQVGTTHSIQLTRTFNGQHESALLRKAEAIYPRRDLLENAFKTAHFRLRELPGNEMPVWWTAQFDGVRIPFAITAAAVRYYYDLSHAFVSQDFRGSANIKMSRGSLMYAAKISRHKAFEFGNQKFGEGYVVNLELDWYQYCGSQCSMHFTKRRIVVFDSDGGLEAVFLDGNANVEVS